MPINVKDMDDHETVFTWVDPDTNEELTFATGRLEEWIKDAGLSIVLTNVEPEWARMFIRDRGIERHRLARVMQNGGLTYPIIYAEMPRGTHLLLDGHHRYVYAAAHGFTTLPAYLLTREQWEPFIVTGLPKASADMLRHMPSGL